MAKIIHLFWNLLSTLFPEHRCSICMETMLLNKKHKLCCGHAFHTDCIMNWFRSKKNTCPYCRCTGKSELPFIINGNANENNLVTLEWESNENVQSFLNNDNPTHEQTVEAYYIRDINMSVNIEDAFETCVRSLGLDPNNYERQITYEFRVSQYDKFKEFISETLINSTETNNYTLSLNFNKYLRERTESDEYVMKLESYKQLEKMKTKNDHRGLYRSIDLLQLMELGW